MDNNKSCQINTHVKETSKTTRRKERKTDSAPQSPETSEVTRVMKTNLFKRAFLTLVMISVFLWICLNNKIYSFVLIFMLTVFIIKEIVGISKRSERPFHLSNSIVVGFVVSIYSYLVFPIVSKIYPSDVSTYVLRNLPFVCFYSYVLTFMFFVASLRKGKLKSQLGLFALVHLSTYTLAAVARCAMSNLNKGRFWFVFPALLVISNDVSAYIVGKSIGKRPIYKLSPKKTLEGFIGAFVFTTFTGFILGYVYVNHRFLDDKPLPKLQKYIKFGIFTFKFQVQNIYIHVLPFIFVASFIAPFSGFLASALKRAYKKKDFGETIPGHGGIADRMDCQALVIIFTSMYITSFLYVEDRSIASIFNLVCNNFTSEEISILIEMLNARLGRRGIIN